MNIAVIYGGRSGEHEVSLVSATAITRGLLNNKNNKVFLIGISKKGKWFLQSDELCKTITEDEKATLSIVEDEKQLVSIIPGERNASFSVNGTPLNLDVVFPALHGTYGEDGTIQGLFEMAGIPYVGCTHMSSALTMDKEKTKMIWDDAGLPIVPYVCMKRSVMLDSIIYDDFLDKTEKQLGYPMFVKPCCAGSSNGAGKAKNRRELSFAIMEAFMWDDKVLIEKAINAREIECSVTGNSVTYPSDESESAEIENVVAYVPGEIAPSHTFYDFDAKYNDPNGAKLLIPADINENDLEKIRKVACAAYKVLDATGLARVDFFIDKDSNAIYLNEINTMPGFTSISMFPKMCDAAGLDFDNLLELLIEEALKRFEAKEKLSTSR